MYALRINLRCQSCGDVMKLNFKNVNELKEFYAKEYHYCDSCLSNLNKENELFWELVDIEFNKSLL